MIRNNFRRIICVVVVVVLLFTTIATSFAAFNVTKANTIAATSKLTSLKAKAFAVAHESAENGLVYTSKKAYEHYSVGNMVKLMTLYLAFEAVANGKTTLESAITVSKNAQNISIGRERVFLDATKDEIISVRQAITAICVGSANDAAYALAEKISGSTESDFVDMMNAKAKELGMENTCFKDSTGIKIISDGQYSCAADMCLLSWRIVKDFPDCTLFTSLDSQSFEHTSTGQPSTQMISSNNLVTSKMLAGADGLMVGYSKADLYGEAATCKQEGERVFAVVIGEDTPEYRAGELKFLLKYALDNYNVVTLDKEGTYVRMIPIKDGKSLKVKSAVGQTFSYLENKTENAKIETKIVLDGEVIAPVSEGDVIGSLVYEKIITEKDEDGNAIEIKEEIGRVDLVVSEDVDRAGWLTRFIRKILKFFGIGDY